ncbi:mRNA decay protein [Coemansia sp. RSA 1939]|nr:mRNA decay protein [Coemansia sp. RSA 1939]KAJ2610990.1 mRNA decay protein [Coemansia sp. RSA 1804]KAJ2694078.1 mRNA decay protein [Coemansia sp. RSA 1285]
MNEGILKHHEQLRERQRTNIDSWCGRAPVLASQGLDSSMKKNTGFIKKCKAGMGQESSAQLVREVKLLKLEKYVSEIVPAVADGLAKCRTTADFAAANDVMSALHSRFPLRFTVPLVKQLLKGLAPPVLSALAAMSPEQREKEEQVRLSRQKTLLRVVAEMYLNGLLWGIDSLSGGVDGLDHTSAFMLSYTPPSSGSTAAGSGTGTSKQVIAKVKEMVQQPGHCILVGALQNLLLSDKDHHLSIVLATSFAKVFRTDLAVGKDDSMELSASSVAPSLEKDSPDSSVVSSDSCKRISTIVNDYLDSAISHLETMHKTLVRMKRNNEERLFNKGVIHADVKEKLEHHTKSFDRLSDNVRMLCEALGREVPHFEESTNDDNQLGIVFDDPAAAEAAREAQSQSQWNSNEERVFYEHVLDLQSELPPSMLSMEGKKAADKNASAAKKSRAPDNHNDSGENASVKTNGNSTTSAVNISLSDNRDAPIEDEENTELEEIKETDIKFYGQSGTMSLDDVDDDGAETLNKAGILEYQRFVEQRKLSGEDAEVGMEDLMDSGNMGTLSLDAADSDSDANPDNSVADQRVAFGEGSATANTQRADYGGGESTMTVVKQTGSSRATVQTIAPTSFATVLQRLTTLTSKDDADKAAISFCYVNTRANREELVRALVDIRRQQLHVIPYYARFITVLHRYFPEIGEGVVDELRRESVWLAKQRFKNLMDVRLKNTRYIAELTKFKVAPLYVSYRCAKNMLEQFHVYNIEVLCALLEGCGRFLLAQPMTSSRISSLLAILMRKRRVLNLDERSSLLIENAYYACMPQSKRRDAAPKFRTPYEMYIRKLVYEDLSRGTADFVCQKLRKLPWSLARGDDPQRIGHALVSCFSKVWKIKYANVYLVTMLLGALGRTHPWLRVAVVDAVMERIKLGLDYNVFSQNQRRITEARYMGEMFIYRVVDTKDILDLLYLILRHGHSETHPYPGRTSDADVSNDYFRIRLACMLLFTCGRYVNSRSANGHRELAKYAVYMQLYVLAKDQPLPVDISYTVDNLFESIFPSATRYETWGEAAQAMSTILQAEELRGSSDDGQEPASRVQALLESEEHVGLDGEMQAEEESFGNGSAADISGFSGMASDSEENASNSDNGDDEDVEADMERIRVEEEEMEEALRQMEELEELLGQEEEENLERELSKLVLDSSEMRKTDRAGNRLDIGIPMSLMGRSSAEQRTLATNLRAADGAGSGGHSPFESRDSEENGEGEDADSEDYNAIRFSLLTGKKQKPVVRGMDIPIESQIAQNLRQQEEVDMREKAHLKRIVLSYERREAEEEQRLHEQELAMRRVSRISATNSSRAPVVPGATFVNRSVQSLHSHKRR